MLLSVGPLSGAAHNHLHTVITEFSRFATARLLLRDSDDGPSPTFQCRGVAGFCNLHLRMDGNKQVGFVLGTWQWLNVSHQFNKLVGFAMCIRTFDLPVHSFR